MPTDCSNPLA